MDFKFIYNELPVNILIVDLDFTVVAITNQHLQTTLRKRHQVVGKNIFEAFKVNTLDKDANGDVLLLYSFNQVIKSKSVHVMSLLKYDILNENQEFEQRYWSVSNHPIFEPDTNELKYILNKGENITEFIRAKEKAERQETIVKRQSQELLEINNSLKKEYSNAVELANSKSSLISNISHELRSPLTSILGHIELISNTVLTDEQKEIIQLANKSGNKLLTIVNNVLDISRITAGNMTLFNENVNLRQMIEKLISSQYIAAYNKNLQLTYSIESDVPTIILSDQSKLEKILQNLLENAIKFTDKGTIFVHANKEEKNSINYIHFEVNDTGIGIHKDKKNQLFKEFIQIHSTDTRRYEGMGLGLTIVKNLVLMMNGNFGFDSILGSGSSFWFEIPLQISSTKEKLVVDESKKIGSLYGKSILVVDDDRIIQRLIKKIFDLSNIKYTGALNGQIALDMYKQKNDFDTILMDIQMPVMDGFDTTKCIREYEQQIGKKPVPIIAMTASVMVSDKLKSYKSGMDDFLGKPFSQKELKSIIETHIV